jgi:hypothetical protein
MRQEPATMDIVARYLSDASQAVRTHASQLLRGEILGTGAIADVQRFALDERHGDDLRRRAMDALGRSPRNEAAQALYDLIQPRALLDAGSVADMRDHAAAALRRSPAPGARALFEQGLASSVRRVRKACARAAGETS